MNIECNHLCYAPQDIHSKCDENVQQHELYEQNLAEITEYFSNANHKLDSCKVMSVAKKDLILKQNILQVILMMLQSKINAK